VDRKAIGDDASPAPAREQLRVYLVHYDAPQWCAESVRSIQASTGVVPLVTIIDNGGARLSLPTSVRVVHLAHNRGFSGAVNVALLDWLARSDPFCIIGSHDLRVESDTLAHLCEAARAEAGFGLLGPDGLPPLGQPLGSKNDTVVDRDWISGTLLLLRRECVDHVGPFDERFGSYVEDVEYCTRARELGWRVGVVPSARATHSGSAISRAAALTSANRALLGVLRSRGSARVKRQATLFLLGMKASLASAFRRPGEGTDDVARDYASARFRAFAATFKRRTEWRDVDPR
jgi:N-acetylglucosaminyl-diphospho-decaprenol L-rhamnosyltransferase